MNNHHTSTIVELGAEDLPAVCPNKSTPLWSYHPRIVLDFNHTQQARCPYCGTIYQLKPGTVIHAH